MILHRLKSSTISSQVLDNFAQNTIQPPTYNLTHNHKVRLYHDQKHSHQSVIRSSPNHTPKPYTLSHTVDNIIILHPQIAQGVKLSPYNLSLQFIYTPQEQLRKHTVRL
jgi:hypothetical protein